MRSTFTVAEGASAAFHYDFTSRYAPAALDVVVACVQGTCRADSKPLAISPDGGIALKRRKPRIAARPAPKTRKAASAAAEEPSSAESLDKDNECAILHDSLKSLHDRDPAIRAFAAKFGEDETRAMAERVRRHYEAKSCAAWLDRRGGVASAWRRVRLARWAISQTN
jgi:hypothetical protein